MVIPWKCSQMASISEQNFPGGAYPLAPTLYEMCLRPCIYITIEAIVSIAVLLSNLAAGDGPVLLSNVSCNQSHSRLSQCVRTEEIGLHSCEGGRIAGVACRTDAPTTTSSTTTSSEVPTLSTSTESTTDTTASRDCSVCARGVSLPAVIGATLGALVLGIIIVGVAMTATAGVIIMRRKRRKKINH